MERLIGFPTVVYTVPLVICLIFWLISALAQFDIDFLDIDAGAETGAANILVALGFTGVPLTLSFSLLFFFAWALSLSCATWVLPLVPSGLFFYLASSVVLLLSFLLSVWWTGLFVQPLSYLFIVHEAPSNHSITGKPCIITSLSVDAGFGQAKVEDGGAGLIISVRAPEGNVFTKGDKALVYDYDAAQNLYHISKLD